MYARSPAARVSEIGRVPVAIATVPTDLEAPTRRFESLPPEAILGQVVAAFAPAIAVSCSFGGPTGLVMVDMLSRQGLLADVEVYYLDTGLLFDATHELRREVEQRYGFAATAYTPRLTLEEQAREHGDSLWERDPNACCAIRKVVPNAEALANKRAWVTGVRRDQSERRAHTPIIEWNERLGLAKVAPLATWSEVQVWEYVERFDVPVNRLHAEGYPSLGCNTVCTSRVANGEDLRAGRWRGTDKTECGLHYSI